MTPDLTDLAWSDMGQPHPHQETDVTDQGMPERRAIPTNPIQHRAIDPELFEMLDAAVNADTHHEALRALVGSAYVLGGRRVTERIERQVAEARMDHAQAAGERDAARAEVQRLTGELDTVGRQLASMTVERDALRERADRVRVLADLVDYGPHAAVVDAARAWRSDLSVVWLDTCREAGTEPHLRRTVDLADAVDALDAGQEAAGDRSHSNAAGPAAPTRGAGDPHGVRDAQRAAEPVGSRDALVSAFRARIGDPGAHLPRAEFETVASWGARAIVATLDAILATAGLTAVAWPSNSSKSVDPADLGPATPATWTAGTGEQP